MFKQWVKKKKFGLNKYINIYNTSNSTSTRVSREKQYRLNIFHVNKINKWIRIVKINKQFWLKLIIKIGLNN